MESDPCCVAPVTPFERRPEEDGRLASLCRALGHPHRVHIVRFLAAQSSCFAGEIADELPIAPSTVSQHLSRLRAAGLVKGEVDGPRRCYCIDPDGLVALKALVQSL